MNPDGTSVTRPAWPVNAHVHLPPNFSAFDSVPELIAQAASESVTVLGATNYYDFTVYDDFVRQALETGIHPLLGLEVIAMIDELRDAGQRVNDPGNPGKMYLCGKGIARWADPPAETARLLETIRTRDAARMAEMTDKLAAIFRDAGIETHLTAKTIIEQVARRHGAGRDAVVCQERHLARAFQEALFDAVDPAGRTQALADLLGKAPDNADDPAAVQGAIRSALIKAGKPAFVAERFVSFSEAKALVLGLGGVPCYPILADGAEPICEFETPVDSLIEQLKLRDIAMVELIPTRNDPAVLGEYVRALRSAGLVVLAGTEHNTLDRGPIEPACEGNTPIDPELRRIFIEGACVVAAHQDRVGRGDPGFVDDAGRPNAHWPDEKARIAAFAKHGAAVIARTADGDDKGT